ncbi:MAG TPA: GDP-mannose 4,6-dehydratase [Gaiellaceae bacterium]|nr:GDP-mannose 4,6-dehydratase [Gaiellaceae bacterium]
MPAPGAGPLSRRAIVTGAAGQDGVYLTELLESKGYEVVGLARGDVDLLDQDALARVLGEHRPDEVYNLASPSFVPRSWEYPVETAEFAAVGVTSLLEAVRAVDGGIRVYQASSSEIFGEPAEVPQTESTPLAPVTPYGVAKAYGHFIIGSYRRRYGLHASAGILYNHESPRRPTSFLPSKVAHGVAAIAAGRERELVLGDLDAQRDWGYARDYVDAMWRMLQQDEAGDYVIATGELHTVGELVEIAFAHVGLDWRDHVRVDESLKRGQAELHHLVGDASKARERLGWAPSVTFEELVKLLVDAARDA